MRATPGAPTSLVQLIGTLVAPGDRFCGTLRDRVGAARLASWMKRYFVSLPMLPTWTRQFPAGGFLTARITSLSWVVCQTVTVTSGKADCSVIVRLLGSTRVNEGLVPLQPTPKSALDRPGPSVMVVSVGDDNGAGIPNACDTFASSISL